jgi:hypothetical protein
MSTRNRHRFASVATFCRSILRQSAAVIGGAPEHEIANEGRRGVIGDGGWFWDLRRQAVLPGYQRNRFDDVASRERLASK